MMVGGDRIIMAARFVNLDRQTPMFLPCDLREWVPEDHIVHFILDAVDQIPTAHFQVNDRGTGSPQYPPAMMLALLIYCYATGRFGSRTIQAATYSDVIVTDVLPTGVSYAGALSVTPGYAIGTPMVNGQTLTWSLANNNA